MVSLSTLHQKITVLVFTYTFIKRVKVKKQNKTRVVKGFSCNSMVVSVVVSAGSIVIE